LFESPSPKVVVYGFSFRTLGIQFEIKSLVSRVYQARMTESKIGLGASVRPSRSTNTSKSHTTLVNNALAVNGRIRFRNINAAHAMSPRERVTSSSAPWTSEAIQGLSCNPAFGWTPYSIRWGSAHFLRAFDYYKKKGEEILGKQLSAAISGQHKIMDAGNFHFDRSATDRGNNRM